MNRHLITVEVRVERRTHQWVDADGLAFHEHGLERLDAEPMERRRPVEKNRVLADDFLEKVPHLGPMSFDHFFCRFDRGRETDLLELVVDERLEQLESHLLGKAALMQFELRSHHDNRAARIVDALSEQVLTEATLLAFQRVRQRLQGPVVRAAEHTTAATVVEKSIHCFLEHALFVTNDNVGRFELHELFQPIVAVDDPAIEIV